MFTMKYRVSETPNTLPMLVELEMDGGFHVNKVWLVIGNLRVACAYEPLAPDPAFSLARTQKDR
jgi:hypothetical protein